MAREVVDASAELSGRNSRRSWLWLIVSIVALVIVSSSLVLLSTATERDISGTAIEGFALLFNVIGIALLAILIGRKIIQLRRDYRNGLPGSRMRSRAVGMVTIITLLPILVVYIFSIISINRSIDSWFDVTMGSGLSDALTLSRTALTLRTRELADHTRIIANELSSGADVLSREDLDRYRRFAGASMVMVVGEPNQILAVSSDFSESALPTLPAPEVFMAARQGRLYTSLDPEGVRGYRLLTAMEIPTQLTGRARIVVVSYPVTAQLSELGNRVQQAHEQYATMIFNRPILKSSFTLTLTMVLMLAVLGAVYAAFFWVSRFVKPVEDLMAGTAAVGRGELNYHLETPSDDELGQLIHSYNRMIERLAQARNDADLRRQIIDGERERLALILARLNSGILALSDNSILLDVNENASRIIGVPLERYKGQSLEVLAQAQPELRTLLELISHPNEHRLALEPTSVDLPVGRRDLSLVYTDLPAVSLGQVGRLWIIDDLTDVLRAQREAAWGEVARRLAHEIKNPLTPIQLSADRLRKRLMTHLSAKEQEILDQGTQTIVHQVEAMRQMVNAFSDYARAPTLVLTSVSLNEVVTQVARLYDSLASHTARHPIRIKRNLRESLPMVYADAHRVRQVVHNLMTNAMEALEGVDAAVIEIETGMAVIDGESMVCLSVRDNGPGFPVGLMDRVFDPYVTSKEKGTGLGLAIVKKIVDEHNAKVLAENSPSGGARVVIYWPESKIQSTGNGG